MFPSDSLLLCISQVAFDVDVCRFSNSRFRKTKSFIVSNKSESHIFCVMAGLIESSATLMLSWGRPESEKDKTCYYCWFISDFKCSLLINTGLISFGKFSIKNPTNGKYYILSFSFPFFLLEASHSIIRESGINLVHNGIRSFQIKFL